MRHETYLEHVTALAAKRLGDADKSKLNAKIIYGTGARQGARGVTYHKGWQNGAPEPIALVELCAFGEHSPAQVAGTLLHELGHVIAGYEAAHGPDWKAACARLGLRKAKAIGTEYYWSRFHPDLREHIHLTQFEDGKPAFGDANGLTVARTTGAGCTAGLGAKGGKSTGPGSGRLRKFTCACNPPVIVRAARDVLAAHCDLCNGPFTRAQPKTGD